MKVSRFSGVTRLHNSDYQLDYSVTLSTECVLIWKNALSFKIPSNSGASDQRFLLLFQKAVETGLTRFHGDQWRRHTEYSGTSTDLFAER